MLAGFGPLQLIGELVTAFEQIPQHRAVEETGPMRSFASEFGSAGVGGLVDPIADETLGEDVMRGLLAGCDQVGVVAVCAAGHGDVQVADITGSVDDDKGVVDGATLGGGGGGGVAELDVIGDVAGGEVDGAVMAGGGEAAVGVDGVDSPPGPVAANPPRSVTVWRSLRRVAISSPTNTGPKPMVILRLSGSSSPARNRRCCACWLSRSTASLVGAINATVSSAWR